LQVHSKSLNRQHEDLQKYLRDRQVTRELTVLVKRHLEVKRKEHILLESDIISLSQLPVSLLKDLRVEARLPVISQTSFFSGLRDGHPRTLRQVCHEGLSEVRTHAEDALFSTADSCSGAFFVDKGQFEYCMSGDEEPVKVGYGHCVSEAGLWVRYWLHCGSLVSTGPGLLYALSANDFIPIISRHMDSNLYVASYAQKFIDKLNADANDMDNDVTDLDELMTWSEAHINGHRTGNILELVTETVSKVLMRSRSRPSVMKGTPSWDDAVNRRPSQDPQFESERQTS